MQNRQPGSYVFLSFIAAIGVIFGASAGVAQDANQPWMNPKLSPEERTELGTQAAHAQ